MGLAEAAVWALLLAPFAVSCAEPPRAVRTPHPDAPEQRPPPRAAWTAVDVPDAGLRLALPDRAGWRLTMSRGFVDAVHASLQARLRARAWRTDAVVNRDGCETEAREMLPSLARVAEAEIFAVEDARRPEAYDTRLRFAMRRVGRGQTEGVMLGFGANVRRCLALELTVRASGRRARQIVIDRLGLLASNLPDSVEVLGVEDRVRLPRSF